MFNMVLIDNSIVANSSLEGKTILNMLNFLETLIRTPPSKTPRSFLLTNFEFFSLSYCNFAGLGQTRRGVFSEPRSQRIYIVSHTSLETSRG